MYECMPHYYKITQGHGQGAETIMAGEAALMQGRFSDAHIHLERAYAQIEGNGQENMALCADFLALRLSLCADTPLRYTPEQRRAALLDWLAGELAGGEAVLDAAVKRVTVQADALLVELEELPLCFRVRAQAGGRGAARPDAACATGG